MQPLGISGSKGLVNGFFKKKSLRSGFLERTRTFVGISMLTLDPAVGLQSDGAAVWANFGRSALKYGALN